MISRRDILKTGLMGFGALSAINPSALNASSSRYGIVGQAAPELEIDYWIDKEGNPTRFKLADHKNKWVFLKCFQSWCPGCHSHGLPALKKLSEALKENPNVVFAGIQTVFEGFSTNTQDKVRATQLQYDLQIAMGHDPGDHGIAPSTMINYHTGGTPWMILINPQHQVVYNEFNINADKAIQFLNSQTT